MESTQRILEIYTEMTPNPESMKFVVNKILLQGKSLDVRDDKHLHVSPLAGKLYEKPYVTGVFITSNFVTVSKTTDKEWMEIIPDLKTLIKSHIENGEKIINETAYKEYLAEQQADVPEEQNDIVSKIKELLDTYVKPAVEMDGGAIEFKSFDNGIVTLILQGSCSGCPSSMLTLKAGIEGMLKRMLPEVKEVVAETEDEQ